MIDAALMLLVPAALVGAIFMAIRKASFRRENTPATSHRRCTCQSDPGEMCEYHHGHMIW